jgi:glycosyltransferase involved in cell wall biosynthesis
VNDVVEVIIPFHLVNDELMQAIDSVKDSLEVSTRIIAVNDSGLSLSKEFLRLRSGDIILDSEDSGYLGAMASGVKASTSSYVAFLDSDDLIHPMKLSEQYKEMQDNHRDLVSCKIVKFSDSHLNFLDFHLLGPLPECLSQQEKLIFGAHGADSSILVNGSILRSTWVSHAHFPPHLADYGWLLLNLPGLNVAHIAEPRYFYRSHAKQMSRTPDLSKEWSEIHDLWLHNLILSFPVLASFTQDITESMSRSIAFPFSFPKLSIRERILTLKILVVIKDELIRRHPCNKRDVLRFMNLRIVFMERALNPFHISLNFELLVRFFIYLVKSKGIKRR